MSNSKKHFNRQPKKPSVLSAKLRKARREQGLSQKELANRLKISDKAISSYESGRVVPSIDALQKISKATYRPVSYFLNEDGPISLELESKLATIERELSEIRMLIRRGQTDEV